MIAGVQFDQAFLDGVNQERLDDLFGSEAHWKSAIPRTMRVRVRVACNDGWWGNFEHLAKHYFGMTGREFIIAHYTKRIGQMVPWDHRVNTVYALMPRYEIAVEG